MEINIRKAVIDNLTGTAPSDISKTITDALSIGDEIVLPGLGVLFEVLWKNTTSELKEQIVTSISNSLK